MEKLNPDPRRQRRSYRWEEASGCVVGLNNDVLVELCGLKAERLVEGGPLVIIQVHGDVHGMAEKA